jgi:hypothetical protein
MSEAYRNSPVYDLMLQSKTPDGRTECTYTNTTTHTQLSSTPHYNMQTMLRKIIVHTSRNRRTAHIKGRSHNSHTMYKFLIGHH